MGNIFDRLAAGPGAMQQQDYSDWNQMIGSTPPDRFREAAHQAITQVPTDEYTQHVTPGLGGTDPLGRLQPQQRAGIAQSIIGALLGSGMGMNELQQQTNLPTLDPNRMSASDLAGLLQYAKQNNPGALSNVATQYRSQPDILHSILSNKALMGLAIGLGAKILTDQMGQNRQMPNQGTRPMM